MRIYTTETLDDEMLETYAALYGDATKILTWETGKEHPQEVRLSGDNYDLDLGVFEHNDEYMSLDEINTTYIVVQVHIEALRRILLANGYNVYRPNDAILLTDMALIDGELHLPTRLGGYILSYG